MAKHESSVNFQNLIRDLAEMYPCDVSEVIITELVANALDARANIISIDFDSSQNALVVTDNGTGMIESQFEEYHDFAAGLKTRGDGIGFAGVGAKVSFNIASRVITETRGGSFCGGSNWHLASKSRLLWEDLPSVGLSGQGTRVEVRFRPGAKLVYSDPEEIIDLLKRNYLPLFDPNFLDLYSRLGCYSSDLRFRVNGAVVEPHSVVDEFKLDKHTEFTPKRAGKRVGYGIVGLAELEYPLGVERCGILLCARGKVIKAELFNQFPGPLGSRIFGVVEIPELVHFLTTSKTDFIRGRRHKDLESLQGPVRDVFRSWLASIGISPLEIAGTSEAAKLQREISKLLEDVPELGEFFGFRAKKSVLSANVTGSVPADEQEGAEETLPDGSGSRGEGPGLSDSGNDVGTSLAENLNGGTLRAEPISRTAKRGPTVSFADMAERVELAWIEGSNIVINSGHPCYQKARSSNSARMLHNLYAVASAVNRFIAESGELPDLVFIDRMMSSWGNK